MRQKMTDEERKASKREAQRKWLEKNPGKKGECDRAWREKNPEHCRELNRKSNRNYRLNNNFANSLRTSLWRIIQNKRKKSKYEVYFGCSCQDLREHIQSQLPVGVTLANFRDLGYSLDHIVPFSAFKNLDNPDHPECESERKLVSHYLNLQVIKMEENQRKANTFDVADIENLKKKIGGLIC